MIIDRLYKDVEEKGVVCVGLDTAMDYIPEHVKEKYQDVEEIVFQFNKTIIDETMDIVPVYKLQIAYYEALGIKGLEAYKRTLNYIRERNIITIGDIKRGDISATAKMYAQAHLAGEFEADFITLSPYMGFDSIDPYLEYVESGEKGLFVLLRTSNPGAKDIQYLDVQGEELYYKVGDGLEKISKKYVSSSGYSPVGVVVGGTYTEEATEIRERYKSMFFLIPGYGHQGGKGDDVRLYLENGNGGIVNSSRGIIKAYSNYEDGAENFGKYAREAVLKMREDIGFEKRV